MDNGMASLGQPLTIFDVYDFNEDGHKDSVVVLYDPNSYPELKAYVALNTDQPADTHQLINPADYGFDRQAQGFAGPIFVGRAIVPEDVVAVRLKGDVKAPNTESVYDTVVLKRIFPQDGGPGWTVTTTIDGQSQTRTLRDQ